MQNIKSIHAFQLAVVSAPLYMRRATPLDVAVIARMIDDAKVRLQDLGTDQWSTDWSDRDGQRRMDRVMSSIKDGNTWLAEFKPRDISFPWIFPAATVTVESAGNPTVWSQAEVSKYPAVYLCRLVVVPEYAGFDIGAAIIDWAGRRARHTYNAQVIRIDTWTTNSFLHQYYEKRGFQRCGLVPDQDYPARQRFERSTAYESHSGPPYIVDSLATVSRPPKTGPARTKRWRGTRGRTDV